ncbi:hypothetical protein ACH5A3_13790 [Streptomyces echinatus]|uniref:hypothetical protein n=1 Tax=Streptomyces echinatus TaxID=67293 RepID=UPI00379AD056
MRLGTDLAGVGAEVLAAALGTEEWVRVRERFARWFADQRASSYARELLNTGKTDPGSPEPLQAVWAPRLRTTLVHAADKNAAARQLRDLIHALAPLPEPLPAPAPAPALAEEPGPAPVGYLVEDAWPDSVRQPAENPGPAPVRHPGEVPEIDAVPYQREIPEPRPAPDPRSESEPRSGPRPEGPPRALPALPPEGPVPVVGDHVDFRQADIHGPVIGVQIQHAYGPRSPIGLPGPDEWPTATALEPLAHGVRPARRTEGGPPLPPYVPRDADEALLSALASAAADGGLVVVLGEPFAGKSRTALALLAAVLPTARVYAPDAGADLRGLPDLLRGAAGHHVLWLDDLDGHLGDGGLEPRLLARLAGLRAVVLATLREDAYDEYRQTPRGRVLDLAQMVELPREWTDAERARAAEQADPRLREAAGLSGPEGIATHLAVEPRLWADFRRSRRKHPRGQALVRAAIDLARCGLRGPLSQDLLVEVAEGYGPLAGTEPETVEEALEWAARERHGVLPLLRREGPRAWSAAGPLVSAARYDEKFPPVRDALWSRALDVARTEKGYDVELVATLAGAAFERAVDGGDRPAMYRLGLLEESLGHHEEAESWFLRAAEAGVPEAAGHMGRLLVERGRSEEAEPLLEQAAQAGDRDAATLLAEALMGRAERWLLAAQRPRGARLLADMRFCVADPELTWDRYDFAASRGYPDVARGLGMYHLVTNERVLAEVWLERAAHAGDKTAAGILRGLQAAQPPLSEVEEYFAHFAESGDYPLDFAHHGVVLERMDRMEGAVEQYRAAYESGDPYGAYRLGALLDRQGKPEEAREWYRRAADQGHHAARKALGELPDGPDTVKE